MKANEAPEKIYLPYKDDRLIGLVKTEGVKFNSGVDGHIEYIRTDAFIEKACEFLKSYRQETYDGLGYTAGIVNDKTIEDFKDYLQNESEMPKKP